MLNTPADVVLWYFEEIERDEAVHDISFASAVRVAVVGALGGGDSMRQWMDEKLVAGGVLKTSFQGQDPNAWRDDLSDEEAAEIARRERIAEENLRSGRVKPAVEREDG